MHDLNRFTPYYSVAPLIESNVRVLLSRMEADTMMLDKNSEPALVHLPRFISLKTRDGSFDVLKYGSRYYKLHLLGDFAIAISWITMRQSYYFNFFAAQLEGCCEAHLEDGGDLSELKDLVAETVTQLTRWYEPLSAEAYLAFEEDFFHAACAVLDLRRVSQQ